MVIAGLALPLGGAPPPAPAVPQMGMGMGSGMHMQQPGMMHQQVKGKRLQPLELSGK